MFSIVIPLYNKEQSVKNTIQSVLTQKFKEFEIVIVNDGSTDNSVQIVEQIQDSRIRIIHQKNGGVSAARNRGIKEAKYDWIAFLDADDIWKENHLQTLVGMIKDFPEDKVFCTSHTKSKYIQTYQPKLINDYEVIEDYFEIVMKNVDFFWTGAVCIHKSVFEKMGGFIVGITRGEDLEMWARIGKKFRIIRSLQNTVTYSIDAENKLTTNKYSFDSSILSVINTKDKKTTFYEHLYYKKIVYERFKRLIRQGNIRDMVKTLKKHGFRFLFRA